MIGGRHVRRAQFERRSLLPVSAACVVANGIRECLSTLLAVRVDLRLLEPAIPDPRAWAAISEGAYVFATRGSACGAAFVLRPNDASTLAAAAFGEQPAERPLSSLEHEVLVRALRALASSLAPICGRDLSPLETVADIAGYVTYFEVLSPAPLPFRIGIALSRDPAPLSPGTLGIADLLDVELELGVTVAQGFMDAGSLLRLRPGVEVPMTTAVGDPGLLTLDAAIVGRGECGVLGNRNVLVLRAAS